MAEPLATMINTGFPLRHEDLGVVQVLFICSMISIFLSMMSTILFTYVDGAKKEQEDKKGVAASNCTAYCKVCSCAMNAYKGWDTIGSFFFVEHLIV